MDKTNSELGRQVQKHLIELGLETESKAFNRDDAHFALKDGVEKFLQYIGQLPDPSRDDTPQRVADMFINDLCWGLDYKKFPKCTTTPNGRMQDVVGKGGLTFKQYVGQYDEMVAVDRIQTISLCEHHFQTIYGYTYIAYIPGPEVLGLSKFARVTEFFARRPQIQERMTQQIYAALAFILKTEDIAVHQICTHFCMKARGAMQADATTRTSKLGGRFMTNGDLRKEFLHGIK